MRLRSDATTATPDGPRRALVPTLRTGPLLPEPSTRDTKDPCPVWDGERWHLFGSGGSSLSERWRILHATATDLHGPWHEEEPSLLVGVTGPGVAAPGVVHEGGRFHCFVQTDFAGLGGTIEHLVSDDGAVFTREGTALASLPGTVEAGIYDPHPSPLPGGRHLVYSGCARARRPDLFLARSTSGSWWGPWTRLGRILGHDEVPHHNQHDHPDYEWGLEGAQVLPLPDGRTLLVAVCFLPSGERGSRQRVFAAVADRPEGPYRTLGPLLHPADGDDWESGENGHAAGVVQGGDLHLLYQARAGGISAPWRYGLARWPLAAFTS